MEKIPFLDVFTENPDGSLALKLPIEINGIRATPGIVIQKGVSFGGIDFQLYKYRDIAVERLEDRTLKITGFFK